MKRILITLLIGAFTLVLVPQSKAQLITLKSSYNSAHDTTKVTNAATAILNTVGVATKGIAQTVTVNIFITKVTGTVAGTVTLQGSLDNVNWATVTSQLSITATFTATDVASQSKSWVVQNNPYQYYRVSWTGTGTMAATIKGQLLVH